MKSSSYSPVTILLLTVIFGSLSVVLGYFIDLPVYEIHPADETDLKLVVRHSGKLLGECQKMEAADLQDLAPNMRSTLVCPREKSRMRVELSIDGAVQFDETLTPSGIHNDGVLALYRVFPLQTGLTTLQLRVQENAGSGVFSQVFEQEVNVEPDQILVLQLDDSGIRAYQPSIDS